jgi:hypothetical protein
MSTTYASVTGDTVDHQRTLVKTFRLQTAIDRAAPGDVIELLPGRYTNPVVITDGGDSGHPLILRGQPDGSVVLDGARDRTEALDNFDPIDDDFAFVKIKTTSWVTLEHLRYKNC